MNFEEADEGHVREFFEHHLGDDEYWDKTAEFLGIPLNTREERLEVLKIIFDAEVEN